MLYKCMKVNDLLMYVGVCFINVCRRMIKQKAIHQLKRLQKFEAQNANVLYFVKEQETKNVCLLQVLWSNQPVSFRFTLRYSAIMVATFYHIFSNIMSKKEETAKEKRRNFMSRNVTQFKHLMKDHFITQNDLQWVINLRDNASPVLNKSQYASPPEVYFKKTKTFEIKTAKSDKQRQSKIVANQYDQIYLKNAEKVHQTQEQIQFYSSLRNNALKGKMHSSGSEKSFDIIPFRDRKQAPKFIKKQFIKSTKPLTKEEMEDGCDGAHNQQPYTSNILKTKNYGLLQSFTKIKGRNQVSLPLLAWQIGLRNYR